MVNPRDIAGENHGLIYIALFHVIHAQLLYKYKSKNVEASALRPLDQEQNVYM